MTLKELKTALASKGFTVVTDTLATSQDTEKSGVTWHHLACREINSSNTDPVMRTIAFDVYVVDEGGPAESAYYKDYVPAKELA